LVSDEQISSDAEVDTARRLVRLFDADPAAAHAQFRDILGRKGLAGKVLQQLNRADRHDAVAALAEGVVFDAKTREQVIVESARAMVRGGDRKRAEALLSSASATRRTDYNFQFAAGRVFAEIRLFTLALPYFEAALAAKPTQAAAERVFSSRLALQQYPEAMQAMGRIVRAGTYREAMAKDFAFLLRHIKLGELDPDIAYALSELPGAETVVGPALMPHLVALDLRDCVLATVDRNVAALSAWNDATLEAVVPYLAKLGQFDHLLRLRDRVDASSPALSALFDVPPARMAQYLVPDVGGFAISGGDAKAYRDAAARFGATADPEDGLKLLRLLPGLIARDDAQRFYAREKHKLARLASRMLAACGKRDEATDALVALVLHVADPRIAQFFAGSDARELAGAIAEAKRQKDAPAGSRLALLREHYTAFFFDRRVGVDPQALVSDVQFTEAAFDYFSTLANWRPALQVPVGRALAERLARPALALGAVAELDVLACWGLMQARPPWSLAVPEQFDEVWWWYLNGFIGRRAIPPQCFNPGIASYLSEILLTDRLAGLNVSRFVQTVCSRSPDYRRRFDLGNLTDRFLLALELVVTFLSRHTQFLPFLTAYLDNPIVARAIESLGGHGLLGAAQGKIAPRPAALAPKGVQDILLVGHAAKETGLGRNFGMLARGLETDGLAVTGLNFDAGADAVSDEIARWYRGRSSRPIVVLAVNAHDAPDIFMKDRGNILGECYTVGFYLWEVSQIPDLQKLGVALVDEIWAPTRYVASIYAPHRPTHVVGKGLFSGDEPFFAHVKTPGANPKLTFATVFDFDSSVERKNPLAAVLAFQRAFQGNEKVELVVKTSNVNPQHWSNTSGQWEKLLAAASGDRRIRIVTERYTNEEMTALVRDADCLVSLHRSEGFGYLLVDAMAFGVPVIATDYSGNVDFCSPETTFPVSYRLIQVPEGAARWRCSGAQWADPDVDAAARQMRAVFEDYVGALAKAGLARQAIRTSLGIDTFKATLAARIRAIATSLE
jgi:glycosyltransferase involved in cell wall biosynthesis